MKDSRFAEITELVAKFDKMGDTEFVRTLAANGVESDELLAYAKHKEKLDRAVRQARRR